MTELFRSWVSVLYVIEETETEFDKTTIQDLFIEFIDFHDKQQLNGIPEGEEIDNKVLD